MWLAWLIAAQCEPSCGGTPAACSTFTSPASCSAQAATGCAWAPNGACAGTHLSCSALPLSACTNTDPAVGASAANHGCYQSASGCAGNPGAAACTTYADQTACLGQDCAWQIGRTQCKGTTCDVGSGRCRDTSGAIRAGCAISAGGCSGSVICSAAATGSCPAQCVNGPGCSQFNGDSGQQACQGAGCNTTLDQTNCPFPTVGPESQAAAEADCGANHSPCRGDFVALFNGNGDANSTWFCYPKQLSCDGTSHCADGGGSLVCNNSDCANQVYGCSLNSCDATNNDPANACSQLVPHFSDGPITYSDGCQDGLAECQSVAQPCYEDPPRSCTGLDDPTCASKAYCNFTAAACQTLALGALSCGTLKQSDCASEANGCAWSDSSVCGGGDVSCSSLAPAACGSVSGCSTTCGAANPVVAEAFRGGACGAGGKCDFALMAAAVWLLRQRRSS